MRSRYRSRSEIVQSVRLYLDDIESILTVLRDHCKEISVVGRDFELDNPLALDEYKRLSDDQILSLEIRGSSPSIVVSPDFFPSSGIRVFVPSDDPTSLGLMNKVLEILRPRSRRLVRWYLGTPGFLAYILLGGVGGSIIFDYLDWGAVATVTLAVILAAVIGLLRYITTMHFLISVPVVLVRDYSHTNKGFVVRNADKIILGALAALAGALLTLLVEFLRRKVGC